VDYFVLKHDHRRRREACWYDVGGESCRESCKKRVYRRILEYIEIEGYPTEASAGFKETKVSDLVYSIISPILSDFRRKTGRKLRLEREKEILSTDGETGEMEEFVIMDAGDKNGGGGVYGFVTTGEIWRMQIRWGVSDDGIHVNTI